MQRLPLILVLSLGCIPISSDVTDVASGLEEARLHRCDDRVSGGPEWCRDLGGRCYGVRVGPNREAAEGTDDMRSDENSACLLPCDDAEGRCPLHHQCQMRDDGSETKAVCAPRGLCRGDADCVEAKYGGHLGTSHCVLDQPAICRAVRENPLDSDGEARSHCDFDSECIALMGEGAECYLQKCQSPADANDWVCEEKALFNGRCRHADKDTVLNPLDSLEGFTVCHTPGASENCALGSICVELRGLQGNRCVKFRISESCQEPEREWSLSSDPEGPTFCLPFVACVPNGNSFGEDSARAACPGFKDTSCSGPHAQMVINQQPCGPGGDSCPDGSNCSAGICFVTDPRSNGFEQYQTVSIRGCNLVD
jgi:hypothetical protein